MQIEFLHHTKDLHKLVESVARVCYQSYNKVNDTSHTMLKGIMSKGHLSVASVGNLVFGVRYDDVNEHSYLTDFLTSSKEINNFVRWSFPSQLNQGSKFSAVFSLNLLSLMDIVEQFPKMYTDNDPILNAIMEYVKEIPYLYWFFDSSTDVPPVENPYHIEAPLLGQPVVLAEDYTKLASILTPYELDIHATVTVDIVTDRAVGLQMWRHGDMTGGCELSQRYVDRGNADYRVPAELLECDEALDIYNAMMDDAIGQYADYQEYLISKLGVTKMRAKEIARNVLPVVETRILQCRPLKQWKHFFNLRCTPHAQAEMRLDATALRNTFQEKGIEV